MACYVIGDIHGCLNEVRRLVEQLNPGASDRLVFLGDYIDRGPDSAGVVSYLLDLRKSALCDTVFLKGNHEDMLMAYLGLPGEHGDAFLYNGGIATLWSYDISPTEAGLAAARLPPDHIEFFKTLRPYYITGEFLCVHAGVHPQKSLEDQSIADMLWIRAEFIRNPHCLPYTVLFGHTPTQEVFFDLPYKIGLDTGLVYGNKLSCLEIEKKVLIQIERGGRKIRRTAVGSKWGGRVRRAP
ncbi:MAG TPA: metallophosphoesterase family protein [candidate division Zixibacteria bacterium]|nr:metallophosphoesterase family protein [candidate division Zixibacteria bacterium]